MFGTEGICKSAGVAVIQRKATRLLKALTPEEIIALDRVKGESKPKRREGA